MLTRVDPFSPFVMAFGSLLHVGKPSAGSKTDGKKGSTTYSPLVMGFDPIGELVSELRRRFGHLAVFFSPGPAGSAGKIGVIWRPSAFVPRPYNVNRSRHMMVVAGGDKPDGGGVLTAVSALEVLAEMKTLGGDMLKGMRLL